MLKKDSFFKNYFVRSSRYNENLPSPDERIAVMEKISTFEKTLEASIEDNSPSSTSTEGFILKKIQSN